MNAEKSVLRHLCDNIGINSGAVYYLARIDRSAVGVYRFYLTVFYIHTGDGGVERNARAVTYGVLGVCDDEIIRAYAARRGI